MSGSITNMLRVVFLWLDGKVYWLVDQLYFLFGMLTEVSIFTQDQIKEFSGRIYVLISIIMLFKLGFSFITYIVNPDAITDKQKGGVALLKNIIIAIVLLVSVPTIFNEASYVQRLIFENNVIDKVLLGDTSIREDDANQQSDNSRMLSTYAFLSFFRPNEKINGCAGFESINVSDSCITALNDSVDDDSKPGNAYKSALTTFNMDYIFESEVVNSTSTGVTGVEGDFYKTDTVYIFDYHFLISTIFGGVLAWILLGFCMDLAVRAVKLGFLQIIAPIPIIMSITPGLKNNPLSSWGKECVSTWASLFIHVLVISFAMSAILLINSGGGVFSFITGGGNTYFMVTVFVMLGLLLFAKEFPKLLEDILGIKGSGKMTFNAWKKLGSVPLLGGAAAAGLTGAGALGLMAGRGLWGTTKSLGKGVGSAFAGNGFGSGFNSGMRDTGARLGARGTAAWSSMKDKVTSAGFGGTDKLGGNMHKAYKENFSSDLNKNEKKSDLGERLYKRAENLESSEKGSKYDIYKNKDFRQSVQRLDALNDDKKAKQSIYEQMNSQIAAGASNVVIRDKDNNVIANYSRDEAVANLEGARIDAVTADGNYQKEKVVLDGLKVKYKNDAERYDAYVAVEDKHKAEKAYKNLVTNTTLRSTGDGGNRYVRDTSDETAMQTRVNDAVGVHDAPSRSEHDARHDDLISAFGVDLGDNGGKLSDAVPGELARGLNNNGGAGTNTPSQPTGNPQSGSQVPRQNGTFSSSSDIPTGGQDL